MPEEPVNEFEEVNQALWDQWTSLHARSSFYDVAGFKAGRTSLRSIELEEVGDVSGKTLLHLQCHFGLDTLSWARRGARATGVDFSPRAIDLARSLSRETGLEARFICADLSSLPDVLSDQFDIVFTSYGVLPWLADLTAWGRIIGRFLRTGGTFYIVEDHPFAQVFDDSGEAEGLRIAYPYFHSPDPLMVEEHGSYAEPEADIHAISYQWDHTLGEVVNSLISAGLTIEFLHEFPCSSFAKVPFMTQDSSGWWWLKLRRSAVPLTFSLKARKP